MIKGIYTSASGMIPRIKKQEISANNLANVSTPGFKRDTIFTRELTRAQQKQIPRKSDWQQPMVDEVFTDYDAGVFQKTGNPLDLAIEGDGFFPLRTSDGGTALTRSGSFTINPEGLLAFGDMPVLGEGGEIEIGSGQVSIAETGEVEVDGSIVGRIVPQTIADLSDLEKIGGSLFAVPEDAEMIAVDKSSILQGFVESSNVNVVREMIDMIVAFRTYEANSKAIQSQDESLQHLFGRVGPRG
ncbi:MAG: flagellar hook-basal body protein [Candidatus Zixiibacteriota bacterium]